ncbi:hypothetical protein Ctu_1p01210 (plasmid) [Cronobacter turicensis z3032]|uniref:Uncharacterized protein n=1 Tax=Cronobacter turicensis (strain DSM 18703 / CCUG 55852 / LMG 23827 / z3032) TaxID=693216 RepID=C9Y5L3_CROTZ|nr:hypothetical protein Ctu_1p01210 [Cronobacter turicensis z3032]
MMAIQMRLIKRLYSSFYYLSKNSLTRELLTKLIYGGKY